MLDVIRNRAGSWGVKILFGVIILVFVFWGMGSFNAQSPNVVLKVNGQNITLNDFAREFNAYVQNAKARMPNLPDSFFQTEEQANRVLGILRDKVLLTQAAEEIGLSVSDAEVQREIMAMPRFRDMDGKFSMQLYERVLAQEKMKKSEFERIVRETLLLLKLQGAVLSAANLSEEEALANFRHLQEQRKVDYYFFSSGDYTDRVEVNDAQIAEYYEKNKNMFTVPKRIDIEYLPINPQALATRYEVGEEQAREYYEANKESFVEAPQAKIRHILFLADRDASPEDMEKLKQRADEVYQKAAAGDDFSELARLNSDDPSAANGGDMGWVNVNDLIPAFSEQISKLNPGELTQPFSSMLGYHIIKVEERKDARQLPFDEVRDQIALLVAGEKGAEDMPVILDQVVGDILGGKELSQMAGELGLGVQRVEGLVQEDAIRSLGIGDDSVESLFLTPEGITIDRPIASGDGYIFVKVNKVQDEHIAPLEQVRDQIVSVLKAEESRAMATREADSLFEALQSGGELPEGTELKNSEFFTRQLGLEEAGPAPEFVDAVFAQSDHEQWIGPYATSRGSIIARLAGVQPPSDEEWQAARELMMAQFGLIKQESLMQAYLTDLQKRAEITHYNPDLIRFSDGQQ
ncbi:MAG: SurA N-terminal domain-containing protein [Desulfovibrionaceae bacterium]|nr:SurA N-terminal domain-containing protein [Desulfovibrionaceae bacterium]